MSLGGAREGNAAARLAGTELVLFVPVKAAARVDAVSWCWPGVVPGLLLFRRAVRDARFIGAWGAAAGAPLPLPNTEAVVNEDAGLIAVGVPRAEAKAARLAGRWPTEEAGLDNCPKAGAPAAGGTAALPLFPPKRAARFAGFRGYEGAACGGAAATAVPPRSVAKALTTFTLLVLLWPC